MVFSENRRHLPHRRCFCGLRSGTCPGLLGVETEAQAKAREQGVGSEATLQTAPHFNIEVMHSSHESSIFCAMRMRCGFFLFALL